MEQNYGTGRRKSSIARVFIKPGSGKFIVNNKELKEYFGRESDISIVMSPIQEVEQENAFDIYVTVKGGGTSGQAGAIKLGIARALINHNIEFRPDLKRAGFMTRDARIVERQKYGQKGARASYQFSKR